MLLVLDKAEKEAGTSTLMRTRRLASAATALSAGPRLLTVIRSWRHMWRNRFSALGLFFRIDYK